MYILNSEQVEYCQVVPQKEDNPEILPGVAYKNKLFTKTASYDKTNPQAAINNTREEFLSHKGQVAFLLVREDTSYTVWAENREIKRLEPKKPEFDLKKLAIEMLNLGGVEIKDRRYNLKTYDRCFVGSEAVKWLCERFNITTSEAVEIGQKLLDENYIHHVTDEHQFENDYLFYRFWEAKLLDGVGEDDLISNMDLDKLVSDMRNIDGVKIKDRRYNLKVYQNCFVGNEAVEWISKYLNVNTEIAVKIGQKLVDRKLIHHVTDSHPFKNEYLFYRFYWDE